MLSHARLRKKRINGLSMPFPKKKKKKKNSEYDMSVYTMCAHVNSRKKNNMDLSKKRRIN